MSKMVVAVLLISLLILSTQASAQNNEIGFSLGGTFTPGANSTQVFHPAVCTAGDPSCLSFAERFHINSQISYQGIYARRLVQTRVASFYFELPVVGVPSRTLDSTVVTVPGFGSTFSRSDFSSVFITPSFRAKFLPDAVVSPFASIGEGIAHFTTRTRFTAFDSSGVPVISSTGNTIHNTLAHQFGVGLDFKTPLPKLGFRLEVRDFLTGQPASDFGSANHHNNVFAGAGLVFHF